MAKRVVKVHPNRENLKRTATHCLEVYKGISEIDLLPAIKMFLREECDKDPKFAHRLADSLNNRMNSDLYLFLPSGDDFNDAL